MWRLLHVEWELCLGDSKSEGHVITIRHVSRYSKCCRESRRNACGSNGGRYAANDRSQSMPESGAQVLFGVGLFVRTLTQRRNRRTPIRVRRQRAGKSAAPSSSAAFPPALPLRAPCSCHSRQPHRALFAGPKGRSHQKPPLSGSVCR